MPAPYLSELKVRGPGNVDFIEVAVDAGTNVSNIQVVVYNPNGTVRSTNTLGTVQTTIAGRDIYVIDPATSATFNGIHLNGGAALVVNGTVVSFLSFNNTLTPTVGPAAGMTSTALGNTANGESYETTDRGATYQTQSSPSSGTIPCFLTGTRIDTPAGPRRVEDLLPGDRVLTEDAGAQPVLWAGMRVLTFAEMHDPRHRPLRIPAGAMGAGLPVRDLYLSPNHRVMLSHPSCALYFQSDDVLAPTKALRGTRGIGAAPVALPIRYHHILLGAHHIVRAEGLPCETFLPERLGVEGFPKTARAEMARALPLLAFDPASFGSAARTVIRAAEVRLLLALAGADALTYRHVQDAAVA